MRFPAVKKCENMSRFDKVTADYKADPFFPDTRYGHTMTKEGNALDKEMQGTMPGAGKQGRPRTAWMDNSNTWTGLSVEDSIRMTEDRHKWRKLVYDVVNHRMEDI